MAADSLVEGWVPAQYVQPEMNDFRHSKLGPKGYKERCKRKRQDQEELEVLHPEPKAETAAADMDVEVEDGGDSKRRKSEGVKFFPVRGSAFHALLALHNGNLTPASAV